MRAVEMPPAHPLRQSLGWGVSFLAHLHLRDRVVSFLRTESWNEKGVGADRPSDPHKIGAGAQASLLETATKRV